MAQLPLYTQLQTALQAGQQEGVETIQQAINALQQLADTEIQRQNTVVDIGQTARGTKDDLDIVKSLVEDNDQIIKQKLDGAWRSTEANGGHRSHEVKNIRPRT